MKRTSKRTAASRKRSPRPPRSPRSPRSPRPPLESALVAFAALARKLGLGWYVFGAQAVNLHGFPRATADLDLTVDLGAYPVPGFLVDLGRAGFTPRFADDQFAAVARVIPVVHRASQLPIDVVLAGPGLEQAFLSEVDSHDVDGIAIPVLSIENLIVTKILAGRPRDIEDVREILAGHASLDHAKVEATLALLERALGDARPDDHFCE